MPYTDASEERGKRIRYAIKISGQPKLLSLAEELNVSPGAVSKWRYGRNFSIDNICRFATVLDTSLDWLLLGRGIPEAHKNTGLSELEQELILLLRVRPKRFTNVLLSLVREVPESPK
ncbi:helix-turn-helix transcriptional regulator [Labrenzia sp. DG1229]|uniref:helix-turn-helix domain-containing protein n=1 Tax=Labrenzia sp. DG1229 TaxID=681847 RepID=UPI00048F5077|nr:helix-turn-helix transcriptional regulator [Labrenzia sp. DG1229]